MTYQLESDIFIVLRVINNLLQICSNCREADQESLLMWNWYENGKCELMATQRGSETVLDRKQRHVKGVPKLTDDQVFAIH